MFALRTPPLEPPLRFPLYIFRRLIALFRAAKRPPLTQRPRRVPQAHGEVRPSVLVVLASRRKEALVDQDYKDAATLAAMVAPYRHARLSAVKLAGDPNNPLRIRDDATAEELRAEVMRHIARLMMRG